jgi:hypothetical protein
VADSGSGFTPEAVPGIGTARDNGRIGGFGLPLVAAFCSRVDWASGRDGTRVEATVRLQPTAASEGYDFPRYVLDEDDEDEAFDE